MNDCRTLTRRRTARQLAQLLDTLGRDPMEDGMMVKKAVTGSCTLNRRTIAVKASR